MNVDHPVSLSQELVHRFLKLGKPVANIRIGTVGSIQTLIPIRELVAEPSR
jgi:hypothetical protein